MLNAFTRNYEDNSTDAGFQFTFYCDICGNGVKSTFIESESYQKKSKIRSFGQGAWAVGNLFSGALNNVGWAVDRGADVLAQRFEGMSPEWQKEHEAAFTAAQEEVRGYFHRCPGCRRWVCDEDYNAQAGLCVECAPLENVAVTKARAEAMINNLDEAAGTQKVWQGNLENKLTLCPSCGQPCGTGKFCSHCGAPLESPACPQCGAPLEAGARFCSECGHKV